MSYRSLRSFFFVLFLVICFCNKFDYLIVNAKVFQSKEKLLIENKNVGIKNGRVYLVPSEEEFDSEEVIDLREYPNYVVSPGFIDIHTHSEFSLPLNPKAEGSIRDGVTTLGVGNCGFSIGPSTIGHFEEFEEFIRYGFMNFPESSDSFLPTYRHAGESFIGFLERVLYNTIGCSTNVVPLTGHGAIRVSVMGNEPREATDGEISRMREILRQELESGVSGLSVGLGYVPGIYTTTKELISLAELVSEYNGIMTFHMRDEGSRILEAIDEVITISRETNARVQISHFKQRHETDKLLFLESSVEKIREAKQIMGADSIGFDVYPYNKYATGLPKLLPTWAKKDTKTMVKNLRDPKTRERIRKDVICGEERFFGDPLEFYCTETAKVPYDKIMVVGLKVEPYKAFEAHDLVTIGKELGSKNNDHNNIIVDPFDVVMDILVAHNGTGCGVIVEGMREENVRELILQEDSVIISDGMSVETNGPTSKKGVHPRFYGSFSRVLGHYSRDVFKEDRLPLTEALYKMTYLPARRFGMENNRGDLKDGFFADITIFDRETIIDKATFKNGHQYSEGVKFVFVNGEMVLRNGNHTNERPGVIIKREVRKSGVSENNEL